MAERGSSYLLQPDVLLPMQYLTRHRHHAMAEQNLVFAILQNAISCYQRHAFARDRQGQRLFRETSEWLMSESREPFSFEYLCEVLNLNAEYLRKGLAHWRHLELERRCGSDQWPQQRAAS